MPDLEDAKVFTTLDAKKGFWQIKLDEKSSILTTFYTSYGKYRFVRLPFGLKPAMEIYQAKQNAILHSLKGVAVIADDILVYGKGRNEEEAMHDHNANLVKLIQRLKAKNSKFSAEKTNLCQKELKFYGHILTCSGMKPDANKISTISNMKAPKDKAELARFLGMVSYLGKFIKKLSDKADILRKLTHNDVEFEWQPKHEDAFKHLQEVTTQTPTLRFFNV